jgi:hypothetical protein
MRSAGSPEHAGRRSSLPILASMIDDGHSVHYTEVRRGTPVYDADEVEIGTVDRVLDNYRENILDGIVIRLDGGLRFVDAPEVARTAERAVTLAITASQARELPPPPGGVANLRPNLGGGRLSRLFGRRS